MAERRQKSNMPPAVRWLVGTHPGLILCAVLFGGVLILALVNAIIGFVKYAFLAVVVAGIVGLIFYLGNRRAVAGRREGHAWQKR